MSLAISFFWLLPCFFPFSVLAGPQDTIYLSSNPVAIPPCAQDCLQAFIAKSFPTSICPNQQDLNCLCTHNSTTGFTLGEGALQCVAAVCPEELYSYAGVYQHCTGVENAQPETHGTLSATVQTMSPEQPPPFSSLPTSISDPTLTISSATSTIVTATSSPPTSTMSSSATSYLTSNSILLAPSTSFLPTPTSASQTLPYTTTAAATSSAAAVVSDKHVLTKQQVAGVAAGGVASATLGFVLVLCILSSRRRRAARNRHSDASFGGDMVIPRPLDPPDRTATTARDSRPGSHSLDPPGAGQREMLAVPSRADELRWSNTWRRSLKPEEIGVGVAPGLMHGSPANDSTYENSPVSVASYRTTSRLLPDKPSMSAVSSYSLFPPPLRINHASRPKSDATIFEEDGLYGPRTSMRSPRHTGRGRGSVDTSPTPVQRTLYASASDPFLSSSTDPRALTNARDQGRQSSTQFPLPPTHSPSPPRTYPYPRTRSPDGLRPLPPLLNALTSPANLSSRSLPLQRKPIAPSTRSPPPAMTALTSPTNLSSKSLSMQRKPTLASIRPPLATIRSANSNPRRARPATHLSTTSDTSFESDIYDLSDLSDLPYPFSSLLPPSSTNPEPFLSPVREAEEGSARKVPPTDPIAAEPAPLRSPLADLRYPRVPPTATSPCRPPAASPPPAPSDTPTRKPPPAPQARRKPVELEGSAVRHTRNSSIVAPSNHDRALRVKTSKSEPSLPRTPPAERARRTTAKLMILQNPGLAGLEGLHPSPARSLEDGAVVRR